jgi:hypothetical protein
MSRIDDYVRNKHTYVSDAVLYFILTELKNMWLYGIDKFDVPKVIKKYIENLSGDNRDRFNCAIRKAAKEMFVIMVSKDCEFRTRSPYHDMLAQMLIRYYQCNTIEHFGYSEFSTPDVESIFEQYAQYDEQVYEKYKKLSDDHMKHISKSHHERDIVTYWRVLDYISKEYTEEGLKILLEKDVIDDVCIGDGKTNYYMLAKRYRNDNMKSEFTIDNIDSIQEISDIECFFEEYCTDLDADFYYGMDDYYFHDDIDYNIGLFNSNSTVSELNRRRTKFDVAVHHPAKWNTITFYQAQGSVLRAI